MTIDTTTHRYPAANTAAFMRSRDRYGKLSNMTGGFPLNVNEITFQSPEGLYQALKFPDHANFQKLIAAQRSGMDAKKAAYTKTPPLIAEWDSLRIQAMAFTIALKLSQHPKTFGDALKETENLFIVEKSFRDPFWGAKPDGQHLTGINALGKILTIAKEGLNTTGRQPPHSLAGLMADFPKDPFRINGAPLPQLA